MPTDGTHDLAPVDPYLGMVVADRYRIVKRLGGGGMGVIYEAEHLLIGRRVAMKILHAQFASDPDQLRRFQNEARAAATLGHPNIVESLDMGRMPDGSPFLALELLEGSNVEQEIARGGPMTIGRAVRIATQVASALGAAHAKGVVHRDIKPENVFLIERAGLPDHVKVLDFGISKFAEKGSLGAATKTGVMMGTPCYMAPEQMTDASRVDPRTDVYALGVMLYQMLTARLPFDAPSLPLLAMKVMGEEAPSVATLRADVPPAIVALIARAMAKRPEDRVASMQEFAGLLAPFAAHDALPIPIAAVALGGPSLAGVGTPFVTEAARRTASDAPSGAARRSPLPAIAIGATLLLIAGSVGLYFAIGPSTPTPVATPLATPPPTPVALPPVVAPPVVATPVVARPPVAPHLTVPPVAVVDAGSAVVDTRPRPPHHVHGRPHHEGHGAPIVDQPNW